MTSFTKSITTDEEGDLIIEFTEQECKLMDLRIGDTIDWEVDEETGNVLMHILPTAVNNVQK
ncbi:MAG: TrbG/VirB9 family P-type conjugative transfer protein [Gammaproteobacteria bacterium]|nr:TrbG/VirB9 family P-type conjugative transfer protein [Gammaproteobacteria bacterium]